MHVGARTGNILLLLLAAAPGLFFASTSLLPSSFTMYLLTLAAAFVLEGKSLRVVACAVVGVICGWTVAGGCTALLETSSPFPVVQLHVGLITVNNKGWGYLPACGCKCSMEFVARMTGQSEFWWLKVALQCSDVFSVLRPYSALPCKMQIAHELHSSMAMWRTSSHV